jgi:hypothetical protein
MKSAVSEWEDYKLPRYTLVAYGSYPQKDAIGHTFAAARKHGEDGKSLEFAPGVFLFDNEVKDSRYHAMEMIRLLRDGGVQFCLADFDSPTHCFLHHSDSEKVSAFGLTECLKGP